MELASCHTESLQDSHRITCWTLRVPTAQTGHLRPTQLPGFHCGKRHDPPCCQGMLGLGLCPLQRPPPSGMLPADGSETSRVPPCLAVTTDQHRRAPSLLGHGQAVTPSPRGPAKAHRRLPVSEVEDRSPGLPLGWLPVAIQPCPLMAE